ncbi:hypothetical protein HDU79_000447, partial [Rhizoclosmatium sp. JEL0117]
LIQHIFSFIDPSTVLQYTRLCRRIRTSLTDTHFATLNLRRFLHPNDISAHIKPSASPFDLLYFNWPDWYQTAYIALHKRTLEVVDWEAKPADKELMGWPLQNRITGSIPPSLGCLTHLKELFMGRNLLSGPIPSELGLLASLEILHLRANSLSGPIPPSLGNLSNLQQLHLDDNLLSGSIPVELYNLSNLDTLNLNVNTLSGPIPPGISQLTSLKRLSFDSNQLTGPVPLEMGEMVWLDFPLLQWQANRFDQVLPKGFRRDTRMWVALVRQGFRAFEGDTTEVLKLDEMSFEEAFEDYGEVE